MPVTPSIFEPAAGITGKDIVSADIVSVLGAASGQRITGFAVWPNSTTSTRAAGVLLKGLSLVAGTTNVLGAFDCGTDGRYYQFPIPLDISDGCCLDYTAGNYKLAVHFVTVT